MAPVLVLRLPLLPPLMLGDQAQGLLLGRPRVKHARGVLLLRVRVPPLSVLARHLPRPLTLGLLLRPFLPHTVPQLVVPDGRVLLLVWALARAVPPLLPLVLVTLPL